MLSCLSIPMKKIFFKKIIKVESFSLSAFSKSTKSKYASEFLQLNTPSLTDDSVGSLSSSVSSALEYLDPSSKTKLGFTAFLPRY